MRRSGRWFIDPVPGPVGRALLALALLVAAGSAGAVASGPRRAAPPDLVVIHSTGGPTCDAQGRPIWVPAGTLADNIATIERHPRLGIHHMIDRDGRVVSSVPEDQVAHHVLRFSARSIAIELINDGDGRDPFPPAQLDALVRLLQDIRQRHGIGAAGVRRHSDLDLGRMPCAPDRPRKVDPGDAFPFDDVLRRAYGR